MNAKDRKKEREKAKKKKQLQLTGAHKQQSVSFTDSSSSLTVTTNTTSTNNDNTTVTTVTADKSSTSTNTVVKESEKEEQAGTVYLSNPSNFLQDCDVWCTLMLTNVTLLHLDTLALMAEVYFRKCKYISMLRVLVAGPLYRLLHYGQPVTRRDFYGIQ